MLTAVIVDDEPLARSRLRRLLEAQAVHVLGEAEDAAEAIRLAQNLAPDALFLDVEMPDVSGIQAGSMLARTRRLPAIIYVTGYSEYAVPAFEQNALDYLVKPVTPERLAVTLTRLREYSGQNRGIDNLPTESTAQPSAPLRSLPVRVDYTIRFVRVEDVVAAVSRNRQVYIVTAEGEYRTGYTLSQLEAVLPRDRFLRIHDSSIVSIDAVVELLFLGDHTYEVRLSNNLLLRVGRSRYADLQFRMGLRPHT